MIVSDSTALFAFLSSTRFVAASLSRTTSDDGPFVFVFRDVDDEDDEDDDDKDVDASIKVVSSIGVLSGGSAPSG